MRAPGTTATYALLLLGMMFWGGVSVAGKLAVLELPPMTVGVLRYGLAAALLLPMVWRELPPLTRLERADVRLFVVLGVLAPFLNHVTFFVGLLWAPAVHASIIPPTTSPIWLLLLAARLSGERIVRAQVVGTALCLVGVVLVIRPERVLAGGGGLVVAGDVLFAGAGVTWAAYSHLSRVAMRRYTATTCVGVTMALGGLLLVPLAVMERPWRAVMSASTVAWAALLYLAIAGTVLAFIWWNRAMRTLGAGRAAAFSNLVPVFGVLIAWTVLGERLDALQAAGAALAIAGVVVCQRPAAVVARLRGSPRSV